MSSRAYLISDLHLGHKKILDFSPERGGSTVEEHDEWIIEQWNSVVKKRDTVYVLGDIAFSREGLAKCSKLRGNKQCILGNHDLFTVEEYMKYFRVRPGIFKYKGFWLSHAPIHPHELRGKKNIHGHVHSNSVKAEYRQPLCNLMNDLDHRYINVCVEALNGVPISIEEIKGE